MSSRRAWLPALAGAAAVLLLAACRARPDPLPGFPRLVLWAWERPERLPFLNPRAAGVAFLARTVSWPDGHIVSVPRFQPLQVPPGTPLIAVVRIESGRGAPPDPAAVAAEAARPAALPGVRALEIDFDARRSERQWYGRMLAHLRAGLPPPVPLQITALASWCQGEPWIRGLPVADAVPMLFRMGTGETYAGGDFRLALCRASLGVATDELPAIVPHGRRLFVFHPHPWTEETYRGALELARRWR
jgi:hypothetical protein